MTRKGVQLMDFGVASHQDDARSMAPRVGSAGDLAPELLLGAQEDRTTRMDCFGIGSLLYFVRFGQTPFVNDGSASRLRWNNIGCAVDLEPLRKLSLTRPTSSWGS